MKTTLVLAPAFAVLLYTLLVAASPIPGTSDALVVRSGDGKAPAGSSSNDVTGTIPGDGSHQGTVPPIANRVYKRKPNLHRYLSDEWFKHLIKEDLAEIKYLRGTGHWLDKAHAETMEKDLEEKHAWFNSIAEGNPVTSAQGSSTTAGPTSSTSASGSTGTTSRHSTPK